MVVGHDTKGEKEVLKPKSKNGVFLNNTSGVLDFIGTPRTFFYLKELRNDSAIIVLCVHSITFSLCCC